MIDHYDWAGGREAMIRFGPNTGPVVVAVLPLFEEANRTRSFVSGLLRRLADRDIACVLPDLPGQGESLVPTENAMLAGWRTALSSAAIAAAGDRPIHILSFRGGALLDHDVKAASRWQLAPAKGEALVRELLRTSAAAGARVDIDLDNYNDEGSAVTIAGNALSRTLLRDLNAADCVREGAVRVLRLETDPAVADRKVAGAPLWRQSEPGDDPALAALLADDIAGWIARCAN
jgi:pimeloyl-ACP methyl ester carboxylesterase